MNPQSPQRRGPLGDFIIRKPRIISPVKSTMDIAKQIQNNKPQPTDAEIRTKKLKKRWKLFRLWVLDVWQPTLTIVFVGFIICTILGFQIGSLTKGISTSEQNYITSVDSGKEILNNPSFLVHKLPTYVLFKLDIHRVAYYRLISAVFAAAAVLSGFNIGWLVITYFCLVIAYGKVSHAGRYLFTFDATTVGSCLDVYNNSQAYSISNTYIDKLFEFLCTWVSVVGFRYHDLAT